MRGQLHSVTFSLMVVNSAAKSFFFFAFSKHIAISVRPIQKSLCLQNLQNFTKPLHNNRIEIAFRLAIPLHSDWDFLVLLT